MNVLGLLLETSQVSSNALLIDESLTDMYQLLPTFVLSSCMTVGVLVGSVDWIEPFPDSLTVAYQYCVSAARVIVLDVTPSAAVNDVAVL